MITWPDLMERNVDSLVDLVLAKLRGLEDARVLTLACVYLEFN